MSAVLTQSFSTETYVTRRHTLKQQVASGLVLLLGNAESPINFADNVYPFRQDSTFLYYFGLDQPDLAAVLDHDEGREELFGDELTLDHVVWMGSLPTLATRARAAGITATRPLAALPGELQAAVQAGRTVHFLPPYRPGNRIKLQALLSVPPEEAAAHASVELIRTVVAMRSIKTEEEVEQIEAAVDLSVDMHVTAMRTVRPGMLESEVVAEVERVVRLAGGRPAFPAIATVHGEILHNHDYGNRLRSGDLFLLDAGAEVPLGYAGDLSSTFPVDAAFTDRQKTIYDICLDAHAAAVGKLGPGVPNLEVHLTAARVIADGMKELGMIKGRAEDAVAEGACAMFLPCGVGHMLGLDVHDMEALGEEHVGYGGKPKSTQFGLKSLRLARELEPGFVLTVEPGIYFIPQLIDRWRAEGRFTQFLDYDRLDPWRDFGGVRNEENYLITATGRRRLGKAKPMTVEEVEAIRT